MRRFPGFAAHRPFKVAAEDQGPPRRPQCQHGLSPVRVVLVGDAFEPPAPLPEPAPTRCSPTSHNSGNVPSPDWLSSDGHGRGQDRGVLWTIRSRRKCDAWSAAKAYTLSRGHHRPTALPGRRQRWARFAAGLSEARCAGAQPVRARSGAPQHQPDPRMESSRNGWSGRRESNPQPPVGNRRSPSS